MSGEVGEGGNGREGISEKCRTPTLGAGASPYSPGLRSVKLQGGGPAYLLFSVWAGEDMGLPLGSPTNISRSSKRNTLCI